MPPTGHAGRVWRSALAALALAALACGLVQAGARAAEPPFLFMGVEIADRRTDWGAVLGEALAGIDEADLSASSKASLVAAVTAAERQPSLATSIALLGHFSVFASHEPLRQAALAANIDIFRIADLAKYELVARTSARLHTQTDGGIAAVVRVGSSGERYRAWLEWAGGDPPGPLPVDADYERTKLFKSDDDVTHWATETLRKAVTAANEQVNAAGAADVFAAVTAEALKAFPDEFRALEVRLGDATIRADPLDGRAHVEPAAMMVEFLSPTEAQEIMSDAARRAQRGWPAPPVDLNDPATVERLKRTAKFLPAWILSDPEKYNGLFAAEQLHAWGLAKGVVTENPGDPRASTVSYKRSASSGALAPITGDHEFPRGLLDPFGWMANNFRQIYETHDGDVESLAKYTLRMEDWWVNVGLPPGEAYELTRDLQFADFNLHGELHNLQLAMNAIRNPRSPTDRAEAVARFGRTEAAFHEKVKAYNVMMMIAGHRKHLRVLSDTLVDAVAAHNRENPPQPGQDPELPTLADIWEATERATPADDADPAAHDIFNFRKSLEALANGYANLPPDMVKAMAIDMEDQLRRELESPDADPVRAQIRAAIVPTLEQAVGEARRSGAKLRTQAQAFTSLKALRDSPLGKAVETELAALKQPDLDHYLLKLVRGDLTVRRIAVTERDPDGWPRTRIVEEQWSPVRVMEDLRRIAALGETLNWSNETYARRLAAYFAGPSAGADPTFPDRAVRIFLELGRLFDGATPRTVAYRDYDGREHTMTLEPMRVGEGVLNVGHLLFAETIKGAEAATKLWGIKGDLDAVRGLYDAMAQIVSPDRNADPAQRAAALSALASHSLSLQSYAEMSLSRAGFTNAAGAIGETSLLARASNSFGAAAQYSHDPMSREAPAALTQAVMQDLLLAWHPKVAVALALHSMYQAAADAYATHVTRSGLVELLVRNGRWRFPEDGAKPVLEAVFADGQWIEDDAPGRERQCRDRLIAQRGTSGDVSFAPIGLERLFRNPEAPQWPGVAMCKGALGERCPETNGTHVRPRDDLLDLFRVAGHAGKDVPLKATQDAVSNLLGWTGYADWTPQFLRGANARADGVSRRDLASDGIDVPTPEDSTHFVREPIDIDTRPLGIRLSASGVSSTPVETKMQREFGVGARKLYGYLVSQYWVRRQHILDCTMLKPLVEAAGRRAQEERIKALEPTDFLAELAALDARVKAIDDAFWPGIAEAADPYPADWPGDGDKAAILADFRKLTRDIRRALAAIDAWSATPGERDFPHFAIPQVERRSVPGTSQRDRILVPLPPEPERALEAGRTNLLNVLAGVTTYEDAFGKTTRTLGEVARLAASADRLSIRPHHFHGLPPDSASPPASAGQGDGAAASPQVPDKAAFAARLAAHGTLKELETATKAWDKVYTQARQRALDDVTLRMSRFQRRLEAWYMNLLSPGDFVGNPLSGVAAEKPGDLALRHPLWKKILRLALQVARLDLAAKDAPRITPDALAALLGSMTLYPGDGAEAAPPSAGAGDPAAEIAAMKARVEERYEEMLGLVEGMFELDLETDAEEWVLLGEPHVRLSAAPFAASGFTQAQVDDWSRRHVWEIVPASDELIGAVDAIASLSAAAGRSVPEMRAAPAGPAPDDRALAAALGVCAKAARRGGQDYFETTFRAVERGETRDVRYPLVKAGRFLLRVTVLEGNGVPMAQEAALVLVKPGELAGYVRFEGDVRDGVPVLLGFGEPTSPGIHQEVEAPGSGMFKAPLCTFLAREVIDDTGSEPGILAASRLQNRFAARAIGLHEGRTPLVGDPVEALYVGEGRFYLDDELVLSNSGLIYVALEIRDWSGAAPAGAEPAIIAGTTRETGVFVGHYPLNAGEVVRGEATLAIDGEVYTGQSESRVFRPATDSGGITLLAELPVFDTGNLVVTGHFAANEAAKALGGVSGGTIYTNIARNVPVAVSGADFVLANRQPVAAANGFSLSALLEAPDERRSFLVPVGELRGSLEKGGQLALGSIPVRPYATPARTLKILVTDWTGVPLTGDAVAVTVDGAAAASDGDLFAYDALSFSGARDEVVVEARFSGPGGATVAATERLGPEAIGDPLDPREPDLVEIRLPVFAPGRLVLAATPRLVPGGDGTDGTPVDLRVVADAGADPWSALAGELLRMPLAYPVPRGAVLELTGRARLDGHDYDGARTVAAPERGQSNAPVVLELGDFPLRSATAPTVPAEEDGEPETPEPAPVATVTVPELRAMPIEEAAAALAAAGLTIDRVSIEGPLPPGEEGGRVLRQAPAAGDEAAPGALVRVFYHPRRPATPAPVAEAEPGEPDVPLVTAAPGEAPDPDDAAGDPAETASVEAEAEPGPDVDAGAPAAAADFDPVGPWVGVLRVTDIQIDTREVRISCASFERCADTWSGIIVDLLTADAEEEERQRRERENMSTGEKLADAFDFGGAVVEGALKGILIGLGPAGLVGFEMAFDGTDIGFVVAESEDGKLVFDLPGLTPDAAAKLRQATLSRGADGRIAVAMEEEDAGKLARINGHLWGLPDAPDKMRAELRVAVTGEGFGKVALSLAADLEEGAAAFGSLFAGTRAEFENRLRFPSARLKPQLRRLIERIVQITGTDPAEFQDGLFGGG